MKSVCMQRWNDAIPPPSLKPDDQAAVLPPPLLLPSALPLSSGHHALHSPHVHFPPTPRLVTSTHNAYSSSSYDRAPIHVTSNECALPARGDREYDEVLVASPAPMSPADHYFVAAPNVVSIPHPSEQATPGEDVPDLTWTSSEDSDGVCSPLHFDATTTTPWDTMPHGIFFQPPGDSAASGLKHEKALAFLPHATSTSASALSPDELPQPTKKARRPKMCKRRATPRRIASPLAGSTGTSEESESNDDECLGGF